MTAPERFADSQIPLAPRAPSIHDPLYDAGHLYLLRPAAELDYARKKEASSLQQGRTAARGMTGKSYTRTVAKFINQVLATRKAQTALGCPKSVARRGAVKMHLLPSA
jgi:hypothetical protein